MSVTVIFKTTDTKACQWWESKQLEIEKYMAQVDEWKAKTLSIFQKSQFPNGRTIYVDETGIVGVAIESGDYAANVPFGWQRKDKLKMYVPRLNKPEGQTALAEMTAFKKPTSDDAETIGMPNKLNVDHMLVSPAFELANNTLYSMYEAGTWQGANTIKKEVEKASASVEVEWTNLPVTEWLKELAATRDSSIDFIESSIVTIPDASTPEPAIAEGRA